MLNRSNSAHLEDHELMRLHDGELSLRAARDARKHLENCWACRYRAKELRSTVFSFVEYCDSLAAQSAPSESSADRFRRRLYDQAEQHRNQRRRLFSVYERIAGFLPPRVITALTTIACLIYVSFNDQLLPAAKADEILQSAERYEAARFGQVSNAVIHQHLQLYSNGKDLQCELWRTVSGTESRSVCNGDIQFKADLSKIYAANSWDTSQPMSPAAFLHWRAGTYTSIAEFSRDDSRNLITIRYRVLPWIDHAKAGAIREASITLASQTLHSLEQSLRVRTEGGEREIRFREVSYDVLPYSQTPFAAVTAPAVTPPPLPKPSLPPPVIVPSVTDDDLENAEAQLRFTLHQLHHDTRMMPEIGRQNGRVFLRMLVDTEQTQQAIISAVASIPLVNVEVWTPENAPASFLPSPSSVPMNGPGRIYRTSAMRLDELSKCLASAESTANYIDEVQRGMRRAMVPALALRRLSERYPAFRYERVPEPSRAMLDTIAADYIQAIQEQAAQLKSTLLPVLTRCNFIRDEDVPGASPAPERAPDWRAAGSVLERQNRDLESAFNQLFATRESTQAPLEVSEAISKIVLLCNELSSMDPQAFHSRPRAHLTVGPPAKK